MNAMISRLPHTTWTIAAAAALLLQANAYAQTAPAKALAGVSMAFTSEATKATDITTNQNVAFYVPAGQSPTPFLPAGKFAVTINGFVAVDLRGEYAFQAELNGTLKLEINGQNILEGSAHNGTTDLSKPIRLGKGATNVLLATFTGPADGDAYLRLQWKPRDGFVQPIPNASLTHADTPEEEKAQQLRLGRALFVESRCVKCHTDAATATNPELDMDAPSFEEIGSRRNFEWMARWILDPKALRASAHMPKVLHGDKAKEDAQAIAAFLSSLKSGAPKAAAKGDAAAGKKRFETLHCAACHDVPGSTEVIATKVSLKEVAAKFSEGSLSEFLKKPETHYAWIRMPRYNLKDEERQDLAAFLLVHANKPADMSAPTDQEIIVRGRKLVETTGCLNCHNSKHENKFSAKALAQIIDWKTGCLAEKPERAPRFGFSTTERDAIAAFASSNPAALARHVPTDFAERFVGTLNCRECHGQIEGVPHFGLLGAKLKPEWSSRFMTGEVNYKPRPWLAAQMPVFPKYADSLAQGLAMQNGLPPRTASDIPGEKEAVEVGHKLVSNPPLGFACVSCHAVGSAGATQVFEAPGINLVHSGERLQPSFFHRWLRNPPGIDPQTKMPAYFDEEGKSPLTDVYDGDGPKQISALWQYIRLGEKMPVPQE